jgi:pimeloyl-ACP methyl ester carboxylesterase
MCATQEAESMAIEAFAIPYSPGAVDDLRRRLERTRWPDAIEAAGWEYGTDLSFLREICAYWRDGFDWKAQVERIATFRHFRYVGDRFGVHFIHQRGTGPDPLPLILTHGWPGSFLEMLRIIPLLADPGSHGEDPADAFDVVVPSLPGFGYSDRPARRGMNTFRVAELWAGLMRELGYERFAAQGGDFGAAVSTILGLRHGPRVIGVHLNYIPGSYRPYIADGMPLAPAEEAFLREAARWADESGAYAHMQRTQPQTPAYGLNDSPAGLAAWVLEKFRAWADCDGDVLRRFTRDELLANVTLYWMTETIASSLRLYFEGRKAPLQFQEGDYVGVPCAVARFPREAPFPPREWVERGFNVQRWTSMPSGGHFAAAEQPELLAADLREFFRPLRESR